MEQKTIPGSHNKGKKLSAKGKSNFKLAKFPLIPGSNAGKTGSGAYKGLNSKKVSKENLCTHCGIRQKGPGFRFLCRYCFHKADNEPVYSFSPGTISADKLFPETLW